MVMIAGARDRIVGIEEARSIVARFPQGRLVECDASGHLPMLEEPDRVTGAIESWLCEC
jgi:pimeloyl-ACP methyl ester carboxylesterase